MLSNGGANEDRTRDLIVANDALSQLSYSPTAILLYHFNVKKQVKFLF